MLGLSTTIITVVVPAESPAAETKKPQAVQPAARVVGLENQ
jgi:hypothetical protein